MAARDFALFCFAAVATAVLGEPSHRNGTRALRAGGRKFVVVGLPKAGTSSLSKFFACGGVSTSHYWCPAPHRPFEAPPGTLIQLPRDVRGARSCAGGRGRCAANTAGPHPRAPLCRKLFSSVRSSSMLNNGETT